MTKTSVIFIFSMFPLVMSCQNSSGVATDSDSVTENGTDSNTDTVSTDTTTGAADVSTDSATATNQDTDSTVEDSEPPLTSQPSIQLVFRNATSQTVYLPVWSTMETAFNCQKSNGQVCYFFPPYCTTGCEDVSKDDDCGMLCEYWPMLQMVEAGLSVSAVWPGTMFDYVSDYCQDGGRCSRESETPARTYSVSVTAYTDFSCFVNDECATPNEDGILSPAEPKGDEKTVTTSFTVPYGDNIELVISE